MTRRYLVLSAALLAVLGLGLLVAPAFGADTKKPDPKATNNKPDPKATATVAQGTLDDAKKAVTDAQAHLKEANTQAGTAEGTLASTMAKLRREFESSPDLVAALKALKEAQDGLEAAKAPVMEKLQANPDYQKAAAARDDLKAKMKELQEAEKPDQTAIKDAAAKVMEADSKAGKLEEAALSTDPKVKDAQAKVEEASAKVAKLRADFETSLKQNADVVAARKAVDDSRTAKVAAQKALADALSKQTAAQTALNTANKAVQDQPMTKEDYRKKADAEKQALKDKYK